MKDEQHVCKPISFECCRAGVLTAQGSVLRTYHLSNTLHAMLNSFLDLTSKAIAIRSSRERLFRMSIH
eukprot:2837776-Amphidinium_carterae.1